MENQNNVTSNINNPSINIKNTKSSSNLNDIYVYANRINIFAIVVSFFWGIYFFISRHDLTAPISIPFGVLTNWIGPAIFANTIAVWIGLSITKQRKNVHILWIVPIIFLLIAIAVYLLLIISQLQNNPNIEMGGGIAMLLIYFFPIILNLFNVIAAAIVINKNAGKEILSNKILKVYPTYILGSMAILCIIAYLVSKYKYQISYNQQAISSIFWIIFILLIIIVIITLYINYIRNLRKKISSQNNIDDNQSDQQNQG